MHAFVTSKTLGYIIVRPSDATFVMSQSEKPDTKSPDVDVECKNTDPVADISEAEFSDVDEKPLLRRIDI